MLEEAITKNAPYCDPDGAEHYPGDLCPIVDYRNRRVTSLGDPLRTKLENSTVEKARQALVAFFLTKSQQELVALSTFGTDAAAFYPNMYGYGSIFRVTGEAQTQKKAFYQSKEDGLDFIGLYRDPPEHHDLSGYGVVSYLGLRGKVLVWFFSQAANVLDNNRFFGISNRIIEDPVIRPGFMEHRTMLRDINLPDDFNGLGYCEINDFILISKIETLKVVPDTPQTVTSKIRSGIIRLAPRLKTLPTN